MKFFLNIPSYTLLFFIKVYQHTVSFDHSFLKHLFPYSGCKFYPSCSQYMYDAIKKYGAIKGIYKGSKRILSCHPKSKGGYDPLV